MILKKRIYLGVGVTGSVVVPAVVLVVEVVVPFDVVLAGVVDVVVSKLIIISKICVV